MRLCLRVLISQSSGLRFPCNLHTYYTAILGFCIVFIQKKFKKSVFHIKIHCMRLRTPRNIKQAKYLAI